MTGKSQILIPLEKEDEPPEDEPPEEDPPDEAPVVDELPANKVITC